MKKIKFIYHIFKFYIHRSLLYFFWFFPIKSNQFYFDTFNGAAFSCSPKYLFLELLQAKLADVKNCYWTKKKNMVFRIDNIPKENLCEPYSLKTIKKIMTSKFIIVNTNIPSFIPLRNSQILINTCHGGGAYKKSGLDNEVENTNEMRFFAKYRAKQTTYMISSCRKATEAFKTNQLIPEQKNLCIGMPRNDYLINDRYDKDYLREQLGLNSSDFIVLYAPTYRTVKNKAVNTELLLDYVKVGDELKIKFGRNVKFLYRAHYYFSDSKNINDILNVTSYPDMQELLAISDLLITDYSSCMWDFSLIKKPCFLFCPDLDDYDMSRGFYIPFEKLPFPISKSNDELVLKISEFELDDYLKKVTEHQSEMGSFEDGTACKKICELVRKSM